MPIDRHFYHTPEDTYVFIHIGRYHIPNFYNSMVPRVQKGRVIFLYIELYFKTKSFQLILLIGFLYAFMSLTRIVYSCRAKSKIHFYSVHRRV